MVEPRRAGQSGQAVGGSTFRFSEQAAIQPSSEMLIQNNTTAYAKATADRRGFRGGGCVPREKAALIVPAPGAPGIAHVERRRCQPRVVMAGHREPDEHRLRQGDRRRADLSPVGSV